MNDNQLQQNIFAYGADEAGITDRFGDNAALYAHCLAEFLESPNHEALEKSLLEKDWGRAFDAAHALKGTSGNLGLTGYYEALCQLVESLRSRDAAPPPSEYDLVRQEFHNLLRLHAGQEPVPIVRQTEAAETDGPSPRDKRRTNLFVLGAALATLALFILAASSFYKINRSYRDKTQAESGQHLLETGRQIGLYLEAQIENDWSIARSLASSITSSNYRDDEAAFLEIMNRQKQAWGVPDLMLYTADGYCVYADGTVAENGVASQTLAQAIERGRTISIIDSLVTYTLPVTTEQTFRGSKIAAVAVVRDMETMLDKLDFTSFDNQAWIYLTHESGIVISMLSSGDARYTFNVNTLFADADVVSLDGTAAKPDLYGDEDAAFFMTKGAEERYVVSRPISTDETSAIRMRLFYFVPETVVNSNMNAFSRQLSLFSIVIVLLLGGLALVTFMALYRFRRRQFAAAITAREQMFDLLIRNIRTVFGLFDIAEGRAGYVSANAMTVLGEKDWSLEKAGQGYRIRNGSGQETPMLAQINGLLAEWNGKTTFRSGYVRRQSGDNVAYFELTLYPLAGSHSEYVCILQDASDVYAREEAARQAMEMAQRANESKTRFLANMSHDIRTPMNAIMNMSKLALETADDPQKHEAYLNTICDSAQHLLYLINEVLDMSRIESGQTPIVSAPFDLKDEIKKRLETVKPLCAERNQTLLVNLDGLRSEAVRGDALKVSQVVMNLLSNAVKFTPVDGAVRITAEELPSLRSDLVNVRIRVEDTGMGISPEFMPHLFEPFSRADSREMRKIEGSGLGLSICKSYVEAMGGVISVISEPGDGSIFTVELPLQRADLRESEQNKLDLASSTPFAGMRCLVVDDIPTNQVIAKALLERMGFAVDLADNGLEGARVFVNSRSGTYDAIYMDIQMPELDGYQATVRIRESKHPQAHTIPILAMSANVFVEDVEKARIAGMDGYVSKPVVSIDLVEQTVKAMQTRKGRTT